LAPGTTVPTTVTAAMSDDSFADISGATVTYSSNRPSVASVDDKGLVTAKAPGVATIAAAVTIDGKTESGSYAIKVELTWISPAFRLVARGSSRSERAIRATASCCRRDRRRFHRSTLQRRAEA
ncbi:MAG: Ig-like domain-containing protein, partial [Acidobacteriota bacterium]